MRKILLSFLVFSLALCVATPTFAQRFDDPDNKEAKLLQQQKQDRNEAATPSFRQKAGIYYQGVKPVVAKPVFNNTGKINGSPSKDGTVTIICNVEDVWGDGSGYQLLMDNTATQYGVTIPAQGALSENCTVPPTLYDVFSHKLPANADPVCTTQNIMVGDTYTMTIEPGTYDFCFTNPTPGARIWISGDGSYGYGRQDDYTFVAGGTYTFHIYLNEALGRDECDLDVTISVDGPGFGGATSLSMGDIPYVAEPKAVSYTITNIGTEELTLSLTSNSAELTVTGVPASLAPQASANVTVALDQDNVGTYTGDFVLTTNDPNNEIVTVAVTANIIDAVVTGYQYQDFENMEGNLPPGWTASGGYDVFKSHAGSGVNGSTSIRANAYSGSPQANVFTSYVQMGTVPSVSFDYKVYEWNTSNPTPANEVSFGIGVSTDFGATFETVYTVEPGGANEHVPSVDYASVNVQLPQYADQMVIVAVAAISVNSGDFHFYIDNMAVGTPAAADLAAIKVAGPTTPTEGTANTYTVTVKNNGSDTQSAYTVKLMQEGDVEIATLPGTELAASEVANFDFTWTPSASGVTYLYGEVVLEGDAYPENNKTSNLDVNVQGEGTLAITIGTGAEQAYIPVNFYYNKSASQTIYYAHEMGTNGGTINSFMLKPVFDAAYTSTVPVQMYIGETTQTGFASNTEWINPADLTLVYDGTISAPAGQGEMMINFTTPYEYQGGNLVIYTVKVDVAWVGNKFFQTSTTTGSNRTVTLSTDSGELDPSAPTGGSISSNHPNIVFFLETEGMGGVSGIVTDEATAPMEGVKVELAGTQLYTMTNANGEYSFPTLVPGTYTLKATKFAYFDSEADVTITDGGSATQDFVLNPLPRVDISGTVTRADNNAPIGEATISFVGTENYEATTDAAGEYLIADVLAANEYEVTITAEGYVTYIDTIAVETDDINDADFEMDESPIPPAGVTAVDNENSAAVAWYAPGTAPFQEFRYDTGTRDAQLGFQSAFPNSIIGSVHRVPATLTEISWYLSGAADAGGPHTLVKVVVLALNAAGEPTGTVLYSAENLPNVDEQWNTHIFPEPVSAPNGFMIGVANWHSTFIGLGHSNPSAEWPFENNTHYYNSDYTSVAFTVYESAAITTIPMVRAIGSIGGKKIAFDKTGSYNYGDVRSTLVPEAEEIVSVATSPVDAGSPNYKLMQNSAPKVFINYSVYRLLTGAPEAEWTLLSGSVTDTSYTDNGWGSLSSGVYRYAVKANYTNLSSTASLSNELPKNMTAAVYTFNVTTNSGDPVVGATVTLTNQDGEPDHVYTKTIESGSAAVFNDVWLGTYDVVATLAGFNNYSGTVSISANNQSASGELTEITMTPRITGVTPQGTDALVEWSFQPEGAEITFVIPDQWGDGTGYQFLADNTATQLGVTIPATGPIFACASAPANLYDVFSHKMPENADPVCTTQNIMFNSTYVMVIPAGTYDFCFVNPTPGDQLWIAAGDEADGGHGRRNDFVFDASKKYKFTVVTQGTGDWVECEITDAKTGAKSAEFVVYLDGQAAGTTTDMSYLIEDVPAGNHTAKVRANYTSGAETESEDFDFEMPGPTYQLTFNVTSKGAPVSQAVVHLDGLGSGSTNAEGVFVYPDFLGDGEYDYTVTKSGYTTASGTVIVAGADITENVVLSLLGIDETGAGAFTLYPNPANNKLTVARTSTNRATVEIFNASGAVIHTFEMTADKQDIDVSSFGTGVYMIRMIENETTNIKRFIKN